VIEVYLGTDAEAGAAAGAARSRSAGMSGAPAPMLELQAKLECRLRQLPGAVRRQLQVNAGEAVAVIGPNGAGKTTLLRVISKLIEPTAGTLSMEGASLRNELPAHEGHRLGIAQVPEGRRLFPRLTVEDNLRMGAFLPAARAQFASGWSSSTTCSRA
jgi:ABC-type branched-subunit amino acid transport system ATPase component